MRPKPIKPNPKKKKDNARVRKKSTVQDYRFEFHVDSPLVILPYSAQAIMDLKKLFSGSDSNLKRSTTVGSSLDTEKHISVGIEIKRGILKLIDDQCGSELPLLELKWPELSLWHKMRGSDIKGNSKVIFAMNYFNRVLSGWEPLVETFKFDVNWIISMKKWNKDGIVQRSSSEGSSKKFEFHISTFDILNINITSTLLDLYKRVKTYWDLKSAPLPISSGPLKNMPFRDLEGSLLPEPLLSPPTSWVPTVAAPEIDLQVILDAHGIGISLVNKHSEELIYASLRTIILEYCYTSTKHSFNCSVRDMQIDDQMHDSHKQVVMSPAKFNRNDPMSVQPALGISIQKLVVPSVKAHFFHEVQIRFKDFVFNLEEILLLKFYEFLGYTSRGRARSSAEVLEHQANLKASMANSWWLYLSQMEIDLRNVTLSVITTNPLPTDLVTLKRSLGLSLIAFEDASIQLEKFKRQNSLDTFSFLMSEIQEHYRLQLERQAARILISVDFLGNPLGLVTNVSDGISELITKGNVGGLVTNITHGLSNSTAKFMSTLSDSLDLATMDNRHQEIRRRIKKDNTDRIRTGLRGLGVGIMGGMTSILTHTYEGATNEGLPGLVSGFGRGLIGTITKPTVGMLDFATEAASAVRDTSKKILLQGPPVQRIRLPRVCIGPTGLLPAYDSRQAEGQQYFYTSTNAEMDNEEIFLSFDLILTDTACLITTETVRFLTWGHQSSNHGEVFLSVVFEDLIKCKPEVTINKNLAETMLVLSVIRESSVASYTKYGNLIDLRTKTLKVRCSSDRVAKTCADQINGAKAAYEVKKYKLM
ncbi:Vacuolar protein sorting-associated protein 13D [Halotydeus destructor]|nr:Vacuolar protein sorting-associated protein 13D [Halotydeus destructor]